MFFVIIRIELIANGFPSTFSPLPDGKFDFRDLILNKYLLRKALSREMVDLRACQMVGTHFIPTLTGSLMKTKNQATTL